MSRWDWLCEWLGNCNGSWATAMGTANGTSCASKWDCASRWDQLHEGRAKQGNWQLGNDGWARAMAGQGQWQLSKGNNGWTRTTVAWQGQWRHKGKGLHEWLSRMASGWSVVARQQESRQQLGNSAWVCSLCWARDQMGKRATQARG